jgi:hypothetical protein
MFRRALLLLFLGGVFLIIKRAFDAPFSDADLEARDQWANEGGAIPRAEGMIGGADTG